jgi:hypothetical protein
VSLRHLKPFFNDKNETLSKFRQTLGQASLLQLFLACKLTFKEEGIHQKRLLSKTKIIFEGFVGKRMMGRRSLLLNQCL